MSRILLALMLPLLLAGFCTAEESDPANSDDEASWHQLFDGKSLDGWSKWDGQSIERGWEVVDGMLHRSSRGGAIYSTKEFDNFELRFTWKLAKGGNAGVKYRVQHYKKGVYGRPGQLGYEYQIFDDRGRTGNQTAGGLYALVAPPVDKPLNPPGEWNDARIVANGTLIEHWMNGVQVVSIDTTSDQWAQAIKRSKFRPVQGFDSVKRGRIELQDHGHPVWFKRIEIRELNDEE